MSDLIVIGYDNEFRADEVRLAVLKMQKDYLIDLEDAVVAVKTADGKVKLHQSYPLPAAGAVGGASGDCSSARSSSARCWARQSGLPPGRRPAPSPTSASTTPS
jgi:hypothetical protein